MKSIARTLLLALSLSAAMSGSVGVLAAETDGAAHGATAPSKLAQSETGDRQDITSAAGLARTSSADIEAAAGLRHVAMPHSTIDSGPMHVALGNAQWVYVWHSRQTIDQPSLPGTFGQATVNCISIGSHPQNGPFHRTCVLVDTDGDKFSYASTNSPSPRMYGVADSIIIDGAGKYKNIIGEVHNHSTCIEASSVRLDIPSARPSRWIADPRILRLIRMWLEAGVLDSNELHETQRSTPQDAGLSPLLANISCTPCWTSGSINGGGAKRAAASTSRGTPMTS